MTTICELSIREAQTLITRCLDVESLSDWLESETREPVRCTLADQIVKLQRYTGEGRYRLRTWK